MKKQGFVPPPTQKFPRVEQKESGKQVSRTDLPPPPGVVRLSNDVDFAPNEDIRKITLLPGEEIAFGTRATGDGLVDEAKDSLVSHFHCCVERDSLNPQYWFTDLHSHNGSYFRIPKGGIYAGIKPGIIMLAGSLLIEMLRDERDQSVWQVTLPDAPTQTISSPKSKDLTIGKLPDYSIVCANDAYLSSSHAIIKYNPITQTYTLQDGIPGLKAASTNGSWLKMGRETMLFEPNTEFKIGAVTYLLLT